jgi:hypothetical protein
MDSSIAPFMFVHLRSYFSPAIVRRGTSENGKPDPTNQTMALPATSG